MPSPDQIPAEMSQRMLMGGADYIAEQVQAKVLDAGIDGVIINLPFYTPGVVTAAARRCARWSVSDRPGEPRHVRRPGWG